MKNILKCLGLLLFGMVLFSCEMKLTPYNEPDNRLSFSFDYTTDSVTKYTFVYDPATVTLDTLWIPVQTTGYLADFSRKITIEQVKTDGEQAIPGTHYVNFDDDWVVANTVVPANADSAAFPVIVKRDKSLKEKEVTLKLKIIENDWFKSGFPTDIYKTIKISDVLTKPATWNGAINVYIGQYGPVRHQFMIDATMHMGIKMNDEFFKVMIESSYDYTRYWINFFEDALLKENARRKELGLDPLAEADGTLL